MVKRKRTTYAYPRIVRTSHVGGCGPCSKTTHTVTTSSFGVVSRTDESDGAGVPNYRERIANHVSASSNYSRYIDLEERAHVIVRNDARFQACSCQIGSPSWTFKGSYEGGYYEQYDNDLVVTATAGDPFSDGERVACDSRASSAVHSAISNRIRTGLLGETALAGVQRLLDTVKRPFRRASQLTERYLAMHARRIRRANSALRNRGKRYDRSLGLRDNFPTIRRFREFFNGYRRRHRRLTASQLRDLNLFDAYALRLERKIVADLKKDWLTYQFGFMNAVYDIDAVVKAIERSKAIEADVVRVTGYDDLNRASVTESLQSLYYASFPRTYASGADYRARYVFGILASSFGGQYNSVGAQLGFSARAFVPTLWAALPHSWAIDYFTNIDNLIDEWVNRSAKIVFGSFSTTSFRYGKVSVSGTITTASNIYTCRLLRPATRSILAYNRLTVGVLPQLKLEFRVPTSWVQLANLFAVYSK